jgi:hypothetical protein
MKLFYYFIIFLSLNLISCSQLRESAGVTRKSLDEFQIVENPPLVIPPDFNLIPPDQLEEKNIQNVDNELAKEILFGLEDDEIQNQLQLSTMQQILSETDANDISASIREEIDQQFSQEIEANNIFQIDWEDEIEVLDAVKESERIRNKNFEGKSIAEDDVPVKKETIKKKKKKRFFFF